MTRHNILAIIMLLALSACAPRDRYISFSGYAQGGTYTVKLNLNGRDGMIKTKPEQIRDSVDAILWKIDNTLSGYNSNSTLSRFNAGEQVVADDMFIEIYERTYGFYMETEGALDVASAPLFDIWGFGFKNGKMPSDAQVKAVMKDSGMKRLREDMRSCAGDDCLLYAADLLQKESEVNPSLNYNAVAQGYSCDVVAEYLYSLGVKDMMVDIGEIFCDGKNPSGKSWIIGIDRPLDGNDQVGADIHGIFKIPEGPCGVVTSGNYRKFYVKDGKKYAHTIDPRSGYPVTHNLLSATIVAPDATMADAYATYCMVIGLEAAKEFLLSRNDIEGCLIYDDNGTFSTWTSTGFILE